MEFNSFEEFWAALDRLDLAIARVQELQQQTARRLIENAKRKDRLATARGLRQLEATIGALSARIAKLALTSAANERRLRT